MSLHNGAIFVVVTDVRIGGASVRDGGPDGDDAVLWRAVAQGHGGQQRGGSGATHPPRHHRALRRARPRRQVLHPHF